MGGEGEKDRELRMRLIEEVRLNVQGHPQCLMNSTTVGRPSAPGKGNCLQVGALVPKTGEGPTSTIGGGGVCHDCHDFGMVIALLMAPKGFAKTEVSLLGLDSSGKEKASVLVGRPTLRRAILVVSLLSIVGRFSLFSLLFLLFLFSFYYFDFVFRVSCFGP